MKFNDLTPEEQQKLLNKLAKLKALAECKTGNVNETATAAATMTRLMLEYQIELASLGVVEEEAGFSEVPLFAAPRATGLPIWQSSLLNGLAEAHHCGFYADSQTVAYDYFTGRRITEKQYFLVGSAQDIEQVQRLYHFCLSEIERLCCLWKPRGARVADKNDFRLGASRGIVTKVRSELDTVIAEQEACHSAALAVFQAKLQRISEHFKRIGVRTTTRSYRSPGASAYQAGYKAGSSLDLTGRSRAALGSGR